MNKFNMTSTSIEEDKDEEMTTNSDGNKLSIFVMAEAFLNIDSMTHKKLQKLCYYAKAWYLAMYDTNIVNESFEAWIHGAVQPDLYQKYKIYGFEQIPRQINKSEIPEEFISFSNEIYNVYGQLTGDELEKLNHTEGPWIKARGNLKPWQSGNNIIDEEDMKTYYRPFLIENNE